MSHIKIIFGLKVKQLRQERNLSFAELALGTGMSISYLNEIEKGKKYPKEDKIELLARALGTTASELVSPRLTKQLAPLGELLKSQFLNDLHLEVYGIDTNKVIEMLADAPSQVGAFISTLMEISRHHSVQQEHFYFASLRSYQEMHLNYFEDLEQHVDACILRFGLDTDGTVVSIHRLAAILKEEYGYTINDTALMQHDELNGLRSYFVPENSQLFIRNDLTAPQAAFVLGREIAYNYLDIKERNYASTPLQIKSFDHVLENFRSAYFAVALLLHREPLLSDLRVFFNQKKWSPDGFLSIMQGYQASPEMFFHRLTNLLPRFFGLNQLFFLRFSNEWGSTEYHLTKELHLTKLHHPHGNAVREHYCRRWLTIGLLDELHSAQAQKNTPNEAAIAGAQRSTYFGTTDEYLCLTIARAGFPTPNTNISVTIGLEVTDTLRQKIKFLDDAAIPTQIVNQTCERCPITDCAVRAVPPRIVEEQARKQKVLDTLLKL